MTTMEYWMAQHLARYITGLRPDWGYDGVIAVLERAKDMGDAADVAIAAICAARNRDNRTPAVIALPGPHWGHAAVQTKRTAVGKDQTCGTCGLPESQCRSRWAWDHEFVSVSQARERAVAAAETRPRRRPMPPVVNGRPVEDVELP